MSLMETFDPRVPRKEYLSRLMTALLRCLGAERGFLYVWNANRKTWSRVFSLLLPGAHSDLPVSQTLIASAARELKPRLFLDVDKEVAAPDAASLGRLAEQSLRSVVLCPLVGRGEVIGVLYLDSRLSIKRFHQQDVRLLETASRSVTGLLETLNGREELESQNQRLWEMLQEAESHVVPVTDLCEPSSPARRVISLCERVAKSDVSVLLTGETGTGKELMGRFIHSRSQRRDGPFIAVNCGALPEGLLESELFGHRKGAFTGAVDNRPGVLEMAEGGTLFLDEVGELSLASQVKLLRVLQERHVVRIGETQLRPVDFRLMSATLRDLHSMVESHQFRQDLYYRLNVFKVEMVPLRERLMDLPLLVNYLLRSLARRMGTTVRRVGPSVIESLARHNWPGNIRELTNVLERALVLEETEELTVESLPKELLAGLCPSGIPDPGTARIGSDSPSDEGLSPDDVDSYAGALREFELVYFSRLLQSMGPNISAMARRAQLTRLTISRKLNQLGLRPTGPTEQNKTEESV